MKKYAVIGRYENGDTYRMGFYETEAEANIAIEDFIYDVEIDVVSYEVVTAEEAKKYKIYFDF